MHKEFEQLCKKFSQSAEWYDEVRPEYPEALVQDVIRFSAIPVRGRILEICCGTGKAAEMFVARGYSMLCLEIGIDMAAIAGLSLGKGIQHERIH
jgi:hypothetical protein